ncbi:cAMP-independent regulatory protein pac2 [Paramyrothecium foliicola]|nr:cAMP-independent regulatory protein pac2 [Paramyrothecium foliicola]
METYHGYVRTPADAIKLFEACRLGLLPRVQRRLSEKERQSIRSGSVFVWDEREAGMRRWTDGKSWSASRVSGSFLTYREMEGKRGGGFGTSKRGTGKTPDSGRGSDEDHDDGEPEGYRYKADGLMKQSFSITTSTGQHLHLISYYSRPQPGQPDLPQPTSDPTLRGIVPVKGMYPESSMGETNQTPALTRAPMQQPPYIIPQHGHPHNHAHPQQAPYPPQYAQSHGYGWPPSPMATPPYGHYAQAAYPANGQHYMPAVSQPPPPSMPHYTHAPQYERAPLPLPHPKSAGVPLQNQHISQGPSPPRLSDSPRQHNLQAAAQAVMVDPVLNTTSARNPQGPLPALNSMTSGAPATSISAVMSTPPSRNLSVSPPRSLHAEQAAMPSNKASLSALLHPTPSSSDSPSLRPGSANSSPRSCGLAAIEKGGVSEDARALRMLDRKFCL